MEEKKEVMVSQDANAVMTKGIEWTREQIELIKTTVAKNTTDDQLKLFLYTCKRTGLDPLAKQIHCVVRPTKNGPVMSIMTAIDGYRLTADRSGKYAGNDDPIYDNEEKPTKATVTVYKIVAGTRCSFTATARWEQYYPGEAQGFMWRKMPHLMLGKCAEALALRKAFPVELSGVYTVEEMAQAGDIKEEQESPKRKSEGQNIEGQKSPEKMSPPKRESKTGDSGSIKGKVVEFKPKFGRGPCGVLVGDFPVLLKTFDEAMADNLKRHHESGSEIEVVYEFQKSKNPDYPDNAMIKEVIVQAEVGD